ncbi:MAG TPA: hypothetical protein ENH85_12865 [Candidatus Scalindua sp.]|nr:hypothetical protein [Candidatus Scalindua sp.]
MSLLKPIVTDSEIPALPAGRGDPERDAEIILKSIQHRIQHDRKRRAQPPLLACEAQASKLWG